VGKRKVELIALRSGQTPAGGYGAFQGGLSAFGSGTPTENEQNWPIQEQDRGGASAAPSDHAMAAFHDMANVVDFGLKASHQSSAPSGRAPAPQQRQTQDSQDTFEVAPGREAAPFGEEAVAHELQHRAGETQDTLVDAMEQAEVAEIKRSIFRALTRLRSASIKEFDTIARLETQAIDAYNDAHNYRGENPLRHLHEDESEYTTDKLKSFHSA